MRKECRRLSDLFPTTCPIMRPYEAKRNGSRSNGQMEILLKRGPAPCQRGSMFLSKRRRGASGAPGSLQLLAALGYPIEEFANLGVHEFHVGRLGGRSREMALKGGDDDILRMRHLLRGLGGFLGRIVEIPEIGRAHV